MKKHFVLIVSLCMIISSCNKKDRSGIAEGIVVNEFGQPLEDVTVEVDKSSIKTDSYGYYSFSNLSAGEYSIMASKSSYLTSVKQVNILPDEINTIDFTLESGDTFIEISDSVINSNAENGSVLILVNSNASWIVECTATWIDFTSQSGNGNGQISVKYSKNTSPTERSDTVIFRSGSVFKTLKITQSSSINITQVRSILGNDEKDIVDSVYVLFNKPVNVKSIVSEWEYCISDIKYSQTENNHGVKFSYSCAELGGKYPFTISVEDDEGNLLTELIDVAFYRSKIDINATITDFILFDDENKVLISAFNPSMLLWYSIDKDTITDIIDMSSMISPIKLSYNPYNSKVYIMGANPDVYIFDILSNEITKAFTVEPDSLDHPQHPANIPFNMGFTQSGSGVVLLKANGSSALRFKLIDCTNNDSLYIYPYYNDTIDEYTDYIDIKANYDFTKLFMQEPYGSCNYGIFDGIENHISLLRPSSITRSHSVIPNRKGDLFYVRQLYDQFIMDLDGNMSMISYLDSRHDGKADFSYRENEDGIVYICEAQSFVGNPNSFQILDYNSGTTLLRSQLIDGLKNFTTTIDGKKAIAHKLNSNATNSLYVFNTAVFYSNVDISD